MSDNSTPDPEFAEEEKRRRELNLLLPWFEPSEYGCSPTPVFTAPAGDFSVRDELTDPNEDPLRPDKERGDDQMSARAQLFHRLVVDAGLSPYWADRKIDALTHELAERIRAAYSGDGPDEDNWISNPYDAAKLIDPNEGMARPDEEPTA